MNIYNQVTGRFDVWSPIYVLKWGPGTIIPCLHKIGTSSQNELWRGTFFALFILDICIVHAPDLTRVFYEWGCHMLARIPITLEALEVWGAWRSRVLLGIEFCYSRAGSRMKSVQWTVSPLVHYAALKTDAETCTVKVVKMPRYPNSVQRCDHMFNSTSCILCMHTRF